MQSLRLLEKFNKKLMGSVWLFPVILAIPLIFMTALGISGSSMGSYHSVLASHTKDQKLLFNKPESIRSDEWLVVTQMTIAQKYNNFDRINKNIGTGEDMSIFGSVPYKDWSAIFKPENFAFFVLPLDNAFAFKWWIIGYILVVTCYFLVLFFLPGKRLIAALLSISLVASPFIQWWYQFSTLASIYYPILLGLLSLYMIRAKKIYVKLLLSIGIYYSSVAFALILYPPFMIPVIVVVASLVGGYLLEIFKRKDAANLAKQLCWVIAPLILAGITVLAYIKTRSSVIDIINNTAYPGKRVSLGGGISYVDLFSGFLQGQLQNPIKALAYKLNQSEVSNFILIGQFLILPSAYLIYRRFRDSKIIDWPLLIVNAVFIVFVVRELSTVLDPILQTFFFDKIPARRLIIGLGLLNILLITLFIRSRDNLKLKLPKYTNEIYSFLIFILTTLLALKIHFEFPRYIGTLKAIGLAAAVSLIVYLLLRKKFIAGLIILTLLNLYSVIYIHPLYRGTYELTKNPVAVEIQRIENISNKRWVAEGIYYENFPQLNGARSLSGVYIYPQMQLWKPLSPKNSNVYNRYAHVIFQIDRSNLDNKTVLEPYQADAFFVKTSPCSNFLLKNDVGFLLTDRPIISSCTKQIKKIPYLERVFYIYELKTK